MNKKHLLTLTFILTSGLVLVGCKQKKLNNFSDATDRYISIFDSFEHMQIVQVQKITDLSGPAGSIHTRAICKDRNGNLVHIDQDNAQYWHGGITFANQDDTVMVASYTDSKDSTIRHIIEDLTAMHNAKYWLNHHKRIKCAKGNKLCFVTGTHIIIDYNNNINYLVKCVDEDGNIVLTHEINPTGDIVNVTRGDEISVAPTPDNEHRAKFVCILERDKVR